MTTTEILARRREWLAESTETMLLEENAALRMELDEERNNRQAYRDLAVAALENVSQLTKRNMQLAERIDVLNTQLRQLMTDQRDLGQQEPSRPVTRSPRRKAFDDTFLIPQTSFVEQPEAAR